MSLLKTLLLLSPCLAGSSPAEPMRSEPGSENAVRFGFYDPSLATAGEIDPISSASGLSKWTVNLLYSRLVRLNEKGVVEPDLALSWNVSADQLEWTFELRRDIRWHDGMPVTPEDVVFTYLKLLDANRSSPSRGNLKFVDSIKAVSSHSIRIRLKSPDPALLYQLTQEITPRLDCREGARLVKDDCAQEERRLRLVGSGPFRWGAMLDDGTIRLDANADYYEGRPSVEHVVIRRYPTKQAAWNAFMRQEIDLLLFMSPEEYNIVKNDPTFTAYAVTDPGQYFISYRLDRKPLSSADVRTAIGLIVDRADLIRRVEAGRAIPSVGPLYTRMNDDHGFLAEPAKCNFEQARSLIQRAGMDAGWTGEGGPQEHAFELSLAADLSDDRKRRIAQWFRQRLSMIGLRIRVIDESEYPDRADEADMRLMMMLSSPVDHNESVKIWHSKDERLPAANKCCLDACSFDSMIESARVESHREKREAIYQSIQSCINQNNAAIFLYYPIVYHAANARVEQTEKYCNVFMPGYKVKDFKIKNERG